MVRNSNKIYCICILSLILIVSININVNDNLINKPLNSTFTFIRYIDNKDISDNVNISIWIPSNTINFENMWNKSSFKIITTNISEYIFIDISLYDYIWIEVNSINDIYFLTDNVLIDYHGINSILINNVNKSYINYTFIISSYAERFIYI